MTDKRPFAVVTGGSSGIGLELARLFARDGYDVLIAAEDAAELQQARAQLTDGAATITTHAADLATEEGVASLAAAVAGRDVDAVALNAGVGLGGRFTETDLDRELRMIDLNCRGMVQLAKTVVASMVARGRGRVLITSSVAASMPDPFEAVYGATKAFGRWFGQGLREELKGTGVSVTLLMPAVTETNFFRRADMMDTKAGTMKKDDPALVAKAGYDAMLAGRDHVIPTAKNKLMGFIADNLPDPVAAKLHRGLSEPGTAEKSGGSRSSAAPLAIGAVALGAGAALFAHWRGGRGETAPHAQDAARPMSTTPGAQPLPANVPTAQEIRVGA
ncbi:MAG TPA: SDR family NAD(P)-dependent oxidoreductase [Sphingomonas sp.]|jgi:short-subunit dehydrogenase